MANEFLTQDEVDALLKGVSGDAEAPAQEDAPGGVRPYNLATQERIVRGRMPALEIINERFARSLRVGLFNFMRRSPEISVGPVRVIKYSEFVRNLVVPTNLNIVQVKPLRGSGLFVFEPSLVFLVVDNLFGGDGRFHMRVEGRDFTPTEQRIIQNLLEVIFEEYQKAWQPVYPLTFEYVRSEMNTQFANIATPSEVVISITFNLEFAGNTSELHICLPYSMIEPIRDMLHSSMHSEQTGTDSRWTSMLTRQLQTAEVELIATLATTTLTLGQIVEMKVGDVIPLTIEATMQAAVDGVPVIESRYGIHNGQYALKIERFLAEVET